MTLRNGLATATTKERAEHNMNTTYGNGDGARSSAVPYIRPAWTPLTIAMMIIGFMIFWPLGLAMLAYILWGDRLDEFKERANFRSAGRGCNWKRQSGWNERTGNVAFDDWRAGEIERLEEERRKLDEMRREFDEHLRELRRARDEEEFDAFMKARRSRAARADRDEAEDISGDTPAKGKRKPGRPSVPEV